MRDQFGSTETFAPYFYSVLFSRLGINKGRNAWLEKPRIQVFCSTDRRFLSRALRPASSTALVRLPCCTQPGDLGSSVATAEATAAGNRPTVTVDGLGNGGSNNARRIRTATAVLISKL